MNAQTFHTSNPTHGTANLSSHDRIQLCLRAHQECMEAFQYCLQRGGDHADPHHLKLMQTCIEITNSAARFMMLQSPYQHMLSEICSQVCVACSKSCGEMNDDALLDCAKACMACAEACRH